MEGIKNNNFKNKNKKFFGIIKLLVATIKPVKIIKLSIFIFKLDILFMNKILCFYQGLIKTLDYFKNYSEALTFAATSAGTQDSHSE